MNLLTTNEEGQCTTCCTKLNSSNSTINSPVKYNIVEVKVRLFISIQVLSHDTTLILNRRNVEDELENVQTLAKDFDTVIVGDLERSKLVQECDKLGTTVMNKYPESDMAKQYQKLADEIMKGFEEDA